MSGAPCILVIAELVDGGSSKITLELLGLARSLAQAGGGNVAAALLAADEQDTAAALIAHGADRVFFTGHAALAGYHGEAWVAAAAEICRAAAPTVVLVGHTASGADLAPRLAFRLDTMIATGCVEVAFEGAKLIATRPCYGGNAREAVSIKTSPVILTVRPGSCDALAADRTRKGKVTCVAPQIDAAARRVRVLERRRDADDAARLEGARVIVAGGRGMNGPEGFRVLEALAAALGGAVGASRVPCDLEWCPRSWQIGLTGRTVRPDLYIAVGISGAGHHMAGCGNAKAIVAVNTDPEAAIFKDARYGVVGDFQEFVPAFIEEVRKLGI
jgi:electron transfer flavoprotein alpha subunit